MDAYKGIFSTCMRVWDIKSIPKEDVDQEEEEEEMAASQVKVLSLVGACVCFSSWKGWAEKLHTFTLWF